MSRALSKTLEREISSFQDDLGQHLEERLFDQLNPYLQLIAQWFAYIILTQTRCELSLDGGEETLVKTQREFYLADYDSLDQFLNEYNGITYPSFDDEYAQHDSYRQEFEQLTYSWVYQQFYCFVRDSFPDCTQQEWENICQTAIDIYHADHTICDTAQYLTDKVLPCNVKFLFELGKESAKRQWKEEQQKQQHRQSEEERKKKIVDDLWRKIEAMYYLKYTRQIPHKIDKLEYEHRLLPVLRDLIKNGVKVESISILGECFWFRFSESVAASIAKFRSTAVDEI